MNIFPAIDLVKGCAVRLFKGDYSQMTVYSERPEDVARDFECKGAKYLHLVDLEGARDGGTPNIDAVKKIRANTSMFIEIGGGVRDMDTVDTYFSVGIDRVILGTAAVKDEAFLRAAIEKYGDKIAVGVDIKDKMVAIKGWTEKSEFDGIEFCKKMQGIGVSTIICTDISRDGAMRGTNRELYRELSETLGLNITASGGVSTIDDVRALASMGLYGAIIGKAYYTGAIDLCEAIEVAK